MSANDACKPALKHALFLCRKAGAVAAGFDAVSQCLEADRAKLVLLSCDVSEGTSRRLLRKAKNDVPVKSLGCSKEAMADVFRKPVAVLCISDEHLANLCLMKIEENR